MWQLNRGDHMAGLIVYCNYWRSWCFFSGTMDLSLGDSVGELLYSSNTFSFLSPPLHLYVLTWGKSHKICNHITFNLYGKIDLHSLGKVITCQLLKDNNLIIGCIMSSCPVTNSSCIFKTATSLTIYKNYKMRKEWDSWGNTAWLSLESWGNTAWMSLEKNG